MRILLIALAGLLVACDTSTELSAPEITPEVSEVNSEPPLDLSREHLAELAGASEMEDKLDDVTPSIKLDFSEDSQKRVRLKTGLLTDEEAESLRETVNGAELKLEIDSR